MHPVLWNFPIPVYTYGACVALAFLLGIKITLDRTAKAGIDRNFIMNLCLIILAASVVGARLLYIAEQWEYFRVNPKEMWMVHRGGLSYFGGLASALLAAIVTVRLRGLQCLPIADAFMPAVALGQAIGRLGCYFNGCCYGIVEQGWFSVMFPKGSPAFSDQVMKGMIPYGWEYSLPVLPAQLITSMTDLFLFCVLCVVDDRKKIPGTTFFTYLAGYGLLRFLCEFLRADSRFWIPGFTLPQLLALGGLAVGLAGLLYLYIRPRPSAARS